MKAMFTRTDFHHNGWQRHVETHCQNYKRQWACLLQTQRWHCASAVLCFSHLHPPKCLHPKGREAENSVNTAKLQPTNHAADILKQLECWLFQEIVSSNYPMCKDNSKRLLQSHLAGKQNRRTKLCPSSSSGFKRKEKYRRQIRELKMW